jgi:DNA modification methylase
MIYHGDCLDIMPTLEDKSIDLTVTSPPYDNLRTYNGNSAFDFEGIAKELFRVTKDGGVVVWVVADATIKGSETGTSFRQALYFKEIGFNLHDTMIFHKLNAMPLTHNRYDPAFEYMFIFSKGRPMTFNPLREKCIYQGTTKKRFLEVKSSIETSSCSRQRDEKTVVQESKFRKNVWSYPVGIEAEYKTGNHPAIFPEKLATDHVLSWSNEGDTVLDPFAGSGTTGVACLNTGRKFILIEKDAGYCEIIKNRIANHQPLLQAVNA